MSKIAQTWECAFNKKLYFYHDKPLLISHKFCAYKNYYFFLLSLPEEWNRSKWFHVFVTTIKFFYVKATGEVRMSCHLVRFVSYHLPTSQKNIYTEALELFLHNCFMWVSMMFGETQCVFLWLNDFLNVSFCQKIDLSMDFD